LRDGREFTWLAEAEKARFWKRLKERRANIFIFLSQGREGRWRNEKRKKKEEGEEERDWSHWVPV